MKLKTTMRYCIIPIRMEIITKKKVINIGSDVEKRQPSYSVSGDIIGIVIMESKMEFPQKVNCTCIFTLGVFQ